MKKKLVFLFCFFTLGLTAQVPSYIPTNGLVGWWPFNGNANDESGNGKNGSVVGAILSSDRFGHANSAYFFNGSSDYIDVPVQQSNVTNFSMSCWFKCPSSATAGRYRGIIQSSGGTGKALSIQMSADPTFTAPFKLSASINGSGVFNGWITPNTFNDDVWHHVVAVISAPSGSQTNSSQISFYLDGNLINTVSTAVNYSSVSVPFNGSGNTKIGRTEHCCNPTSNFFNGNIDDVSIYNRALTQEEITGLYQSCTTPTANITPQSNTNFCQGNNVVLNATTGTNYTYEWYNNGTLISGAATNSYAATTAGNYTVKVIDGSCNATSSATTLTLIDTVTWTGIVDNDWHKPCNWSPEVVPECCNSVKIPFTPISPVVSGVGKAKNVTLYSTSGATLTVNNGANLQIETCPVNKTENSCPTLPIISTTAISSITQTTAVSGGNITYSGASSITARGVCWSTTASPTVANSKTTDASGTGTFTSNLTTLTAGTTYYVRAYATNASGTSYGNEVSFIAVNPQPAYPMGSVYCNGTPTLVVDVTNPTTGKTWMDRNLGASQAATSSTDVLAYGDLYQWGRGSDGHQCRSASTTSSLSSSIQPTNSNYILAPNTPYDWLSPQNTNLWQNVNGINNPCPSGYRIPTNTEQNTERLSWSVNTSVGAFSSPLKLTVAGYRFYVDGAFHNVNLLGHYWSSVIDVTNSIHLAFSTSNAYMYSNYRSGGFSVRCIKN